MQDRGIDFTTHFREPQLVRVSGPRSPPLQGASSQFTATFPWQVSHWLVSGGACEEHPRIKRTQRPTTYRQLVMGVTQQGVYLSALDPRAVMTRGSGRVEIACRLDDCSLEISPSTGSRPSTEPPELRLVC